ncbi:MAG TPA: hypothetical protein VGF30_01825, partial [Bacteroidia bacterium]
MKKILLLVLSSVTLGLFAQTPFSVSEKKGFNTGMFARNGSVVDLKSFKGNIYAAMGNDTGYVYRSSTGDVGSYQRVFNTFGVTRSQYFTVSNDGGGYMFMSTASTFSTNLVMRTADGTNWDNYFLPPGSGAQNISTFKSAGGVADSVYISYFGSSGGVVIVKNALNANDYNNTLGTWDTLTDMYLQFGTYAYPTASVVFHDSLYYAFSDNSLYHTGNGKDLHVNTDFASQMGSTSGIGNSYCSAMEVYNGDLYLGTQNNTGTGFQLWKTSDGVTFTSIADSLYNSLTTISRMKSAGGKLWVLAKNTGGGFEIYSYDGTTFVLENSNEFGAADIDVNYYSGLEFFNDHLYVGVTHFKMPFMQAGHDGESTFASSSTTGGQIWRACLVGSFPTVNITNGDGDTICKGGNVLLNVGGSAVS